MLYNVNSMFSNKHNVGNTLLILMLSFFKPIINNNNLRTQQLINTNINFNTYIKNYKICRVTGISILQDY